ncbi:DUF2163 domain-containing protein [Serpentinimonas maccroryi]|uniref:DUF2163 domain-containing protein n=1 Tax=Serpentinimonas maccroryi TaxID=1458426 RepID=UPI00203390EB|nr:DUF2163 domain-containing protein [Serpentinimonas maccroryi]MCM2480209.1 DUF2163 domain-containing protein [Serpentinimonas maccroryi]
MNTLPDAIELYAFQSATATFHLTPHEFAVDLGGQAYASAALSRSALALGAEAAKTALHLRLPPDQALVSHLLASAITGQVTTLTLRLARHDGIGWAISGTRWVGRVLGVEIADDLAQVACESAQVSLKRIGLRRLYSRQCSHVLYSAACGAQPLTHSAPVLRSQGKRIDIEGGLPPTVAAAGGWLQTPAGARHMIVATLPGGSGVELLYPLALPVGSVVQIVAGCDHSTATCAQRFNNLDNYGGFPFLPRKNPFATGVF